MARKRTIGKRKVRNGFNASRAEAKVDEITVNMEREIARQNAGTDKVLNQSDAAREKLARQGIFGGLSG